MADTTISEELKTIIDTKKDILAAIIEKGVETEANAPFSKYVDYIKSIDGEASDSWSEIQPNITLKTFRFPEKVVLDEPITEEVLEGVIVDEEDRTGMVGVEIQQESAYIWCACRLEDFDDAYQIMASYSTTDQKTYTLNMDELLMMEESITNEFGNKYFTFYKNVVSCAIPQKLGIAKHWVYGMSSFVEVKTTE